VVSSAARDAAVRQSSKVDQLAGWPVGQRERLRVCMGLRGGVGERRYSAKVQKCKGGKMDRDRDRDSVV